MSLLTPDLRDLIAAGPLAHLTTINADGGPQVSVIWIGLPDGSSAAETEADDVLVSGHLGHYAKLRNIERDPRVALSFLAPRDHSVTLSPYAVLHCRATVVPSEEAWDLLDRLTKTYQSPEATFPAPRGPGWTVRYEVERVTGVGPWAG